MKKLFSYSGNPKDSLIDEVRFKIGDTDKDYYLLEDEEIEFVLESVNNSILESCIACVRAILPKLAKEVDYAIGPEKVNASDRYKHYSSILNSMISEKISKTSYIISADQCEHKPNFEIGMHDNPQWIHK